MSSTADKRGKNPGTGRTSRKKAWGENIQSTEKQRELRETILFETAARLFNRYGFHGTSMSQLTQELGLTKGALYYYVKDKTDLLYQLHLKSAEATRKAHDLGVAEGRNGYERIHGIIHHYLRTVTTSPTETFILLEDGALRPEQAKDIMDRRKELELDLRRQIDAGIEDGSIVPCDSKLASFVLVGAMAWVTKWYEHDKPWTSEQVSAEMSAMLGRMISATPEATLPRHVAQT